MFLALALAAQLAGTIPPCPKPAIEAAWVQEWMQNAATVVAGQRTGVGLVVGWHSGEAWIAIPAHVVFGEERPSPDALVAARDDLHIRLFGDASPRSLCPSAPNALNPRPRAPIADLTFVCVQWTGNPVFNAGLLARDITIGDEVQLAGPGVVLPTNGHVVQTPTLEQIAAQSEEVGVNDLNGRKGLSGAPSVNAEGVIGLYLGTDSIARVLSSDAIREYAKRSRVQWDLVESEFYDCRKSRIVCPTVVTNVDPVTIVMKNVHFSSAFNLSTGTCVEIPEGKYQIVTPANGVTCEPKYMTILSTNEKLTIPMRCGPHLGGTWRTDTGDSLICVDTDVAVARCAGLGQLGFGFFEGTLSSNGKAVSLSGGFLSPAGVRHVANGDLVWNVGKLTGEIQREQYPRKHIELTRGPD
jgi:hypothetical protein